MHGRLLEPSTSRRMAWSERGRVVKDAEGEGERFEGAVVVEGVSDRAMGAGKEFRRSGNK